MKKLFYTASLLLLLVTVGKAQKPDFEKVDINKFVAETQQNLGDSKQILLAWYIPNEFWELILKQNKTLTADQINEFLTAFNGYTMVALVDGKVVEQEVVYKSADEIRSSIKLEVGKEKYSPIEEDKLDPLLKQTLAVFKPVLKNIMGALGENFNFYVFKDLNSKNERILDPTKRIDFKIKESGNTFTFRLPLGSLLPTKKCPVDNEKMNGAWEFCPWHGDKLVPDTGK